MEAGFSRMNDLTVIQASQVRDPYLRQTFGLRFIHLRDYAHTFSKMWAMRHIEELLSVMTIDITPNVGQLSLLQLSYPKA